MTGNFTLTLPIMLATGIAAALSKRLTYGSIYTTKLLRRGIDIERPKTANVLQTLTVADVMQPVETGGGDAALLDGHTEPPTRPARDWWEDLGGVVTDVRDPQELFEDETLDQALRQLTMHGGSGLPVLSGDRRHLRGWLTRHGVLAALAQTVAGSDREIEEGAVAADFGAEDPARLAHSASAPLAGYEIVDIRIGAESPVAGRRVRDVPWPPGAVVVSVTKDGEPAAAHPDTVLAPGERIVVLSPARDRLKQSRPAAVSET